MDKDDSAFTARFIAEVRSSLCACGFDPCRLASEHLSAGAAVSGGADSVSLLFSLAAIARDSGFFLHVVTVNHNIRPAAETGGDASYVQHLCADLAARGYPVDCTLKVIQPGEAARAASERGNGGEEAARFLRYRLFDEFARERQVSCICLAHNRNDQLETLLMRFLQGSGGEAAAGIRQKRGIFVRPLLSIPRADIERFLTIQHISWRTDSTNSDTRYLRNRIRHDIMPMLDKTVPGWQTAVLAGGRKTADDEDVIAAAGDAVAWTADGAALRMDRGLFMQQKRAVQVRLLYKAFSAAGAEKRVPYVFAERICAAAGGHEAYRETAAGISVIIGSGDVVIKKEEKTATDCGFSDIIEKSGSYDLPFGCVGVVPDGCGSAAVFLKAGDDVRIDGIRIPFCIRSRQPADEIETAGGTMKNVTDILSDWKVPEKQKDMIPVIQDLSAPEQRISCIWGSVFGYDDWLVKSREK